MRNARRPYDSPKRREQAAATRRRVLARARARFVRDGYAATTIERIAGDAGVAVQTVYATFGSKRAILLALLDEAEREADVAGLRRMLREAARDPRRQLRAIVAFNVGLFTRIRDVLDVVRAAGQADRDLVALARTGERRRRAGQAAVVRAWAAADVLRSGVTAKDAADILWALTGPDNHRLFVRENGWTADRYADWLFATLTKLLIRTRS